MTASAKDFYALAFWLEGWFREDRKAGLPLAGPEQEAVLDELARLWKKQRIDAVLASCERRFGRARVLEVIDLVVATNIRQEWAEVASKEGRNGVEDLARLLLQPLQHGQGFEFTLEPRDGGLQMHCTRCPFADVGAALGISEWIAHLVCGGDPHIVEGFNPRMGFREDLDGAGAVGEGGGGRRDRRTRPAPGQHPSEELDQRVVGVGGIGQVRVPVAQAEVRVVVRV